MYVKVRGDTPPKIDKRLKEIYVSFMVIYIWLWCYYRLFKVSHTCDIAQTGGNLMILTHISLLSFLLDIGKQHSPRSDTAECGVPSGSLLNLRKIVFTYLL